MGELTHQQIGLWVACLVSFVIALGALLTAYRALTKNFVTRPELKSEMLVMEKAIEKEIEVTRHLLRNEMNASFIRLEGKLEILHDGQSSQRESLARIEGVLSLPKTKM
jgi:hypothetical protein